MFCEPLRPPPRPSAVIVETTAQTRKATTRPHRRMRTGGGAPLSTPATLERRLPRLGATGDQHVEPGDHRSLEAPRPLPGERAQGDRLVERVHLQHKLPDRRITWRTRTPSSRP